MLSFTDQQLEAITAAAARLPLQSRTQFLEHIADRLQPDPSDSDVDAAVAEALAAMMQLEEAGRKRLHVG